MGYDERDREYEKELTEYRRKVGEAYNEVYAQLQQLQTEKTEEVNALLREQINGSSEFFHFYLYNLFPQPFFQWKKMDVNWICEEIQNPLVRHWLFLTALVITRMNH